MKISSKLNELKPTDLNCNVFDVYSYDGLSMQELLCQFFTRINECIKVSNETIDLASWLVNEGLKIEVVKKLISWLEDGTLEHLINVTLFNNLNTKIENINTRVTHIEKKEVNILSFGAKGDGITDDTQAIKEAIKSIAGVYDGVNEDTAHYGGGTVVIPRGTFLTTDTIFIPSNVTIKGTGKSTFGINKNNSHSSTILFKGDNDKPAISFIGINKTTNDNEYVYARTGSEVDLRVNIPTFSSVLKDLTVYADNNQDLGIAFGGCPTSRIENVKVSGFKVGVIASSCWGSTIEKLFSYCSFIGVLVHKSCNLLNFKDLYIHINGGIESVDSSSKLYDFVNCEETVLKNSQVAIHLNNSRGVSFDNVTIEKFKNGCNIGSTTISSTTTNWNNVWIEGVKNPIIIKNGRHSFINANYITSESNIENFANVYNSNVVFINTRGAYNNLINDCDKDNETKFVTIASQYTTGNYNFMSNDLNLGLVTLMDNLLPSKTGEVMIGNTSKQIKSFNGQRIYIKDGQYNTGWDILGSDGYSCIAPYVNGSVNWTKDFRFDITKGYVFGDNIMPKTSNNFNLGSNVNCFKNGYFNGIIKTGLGSTTNRPTLEQNDQGSMWFDATLNKPIWWTGTKWVNANGESV